MKKNKNNSMAAYSKILRRCDIIAENRNQLHMKTDKNASKYVNKSMINYILILLSPITDDVQYSMK